MLFAYASLEGNIVRCREVDFGLYPDGFLVDYMLPSLSSYKEGLCSNISVETAWEDTKRFIGVVVHVSKAFRENPLQYGFGENTLTKVLSLKYLFEAYDS